jgi:dTDP-4-amino-4,6-dideoxygalactose transaminase
VIPVQRPTLGPEELAAVAQVFDSRWLGMGVVTQEFEQRLQEFLGARYVIAVNTGTAALHLALAALELHPGDEVIVPSLTFVSSVQAILAVGARPVFCEVKEDTLTVDVDDVVRRVTAKTKAIMPVHYGGLVCEMDELLPFARERKIWLVEDAAHAFGSTYQGRKVGTLGPVTCFSFDPIKNITCGEGGAIATDEEDLARRLLPMRNVGIQKDAWRRQGGAQNWAYEVATPGYRYHLSNLNAAIGLAQLKRFAVFKARKQSIVRRYDEALRDAGGLRLLSRTLDEVFPFFYVVRVLERRRDALIEFLKEKGIGTGVHYIPNHLQPLFADLRVSLPTTERLFDEIVTLPLYYEMTDTDVETVIAAVRAFCRGDTR